MQLSVIKSLTVRARQEGVRETAAELDRLRRAELGLSDASGSMDAATEKAAAAWARKAERTNIFARSLTSAKRELLELQRASDAGVLNAGAFEREQQRIIRAIEVAETRQRAFQRSQMGTDNDNARLGVNDNAAGFRRQNLGFQAQDIAVSLYSGMPVTTVLAQQGSQIAGAYMGAGGGVKALLGDVTAMATGLLRYAGPVAAVLATAYGAYRLLSSYSAEAALSVDSATRALAEQAAPIGSIKSGITELAGLQKTYQETIAATSGVVDAATAKILANNEREFNAKKALLDLELRRQDAAITLQSVETQRAALTARQELSGVNLASPNGRFGGLDDPRMPAGFFRNPDTEATTRRLFEDIENSPAFMQIREMEANLQLTELAADQLREALRSTFKGDIIDPELERKLGQVRSITMDTIAGVRAAERMAGGTVQSYQRERYRESMRDNARMEADVLRAAARTDAERIAAARRVAAAADPVLGHERDVKISNAGVLERARILIELRDAATERSRSLDRTMQQQQQELSLIGRTAGEAAGLRLEYQLLGQLQEEAARRGIEVNQAEVASIHERARAYAEAADQIARRNLGRDLQFERDQLGRSPLDQAVASRLQSGGLDVDLNSGAAAAIRMNEVLKQQAEIWKDIQGVGANAIDTIFDGAMEGADGFKGALKDVARDLLGTFNELAIKNPLKNAIYGGDLPTLDKIGGLGGMFSALTGGKLPGAEKVGGLGRPAGTMLDPIYVSAVGGAGGVLGALGGANDNANYAAGAVTRGPLADIVAAGTTKTGIPLAEVAIQGQVAKVSAQYADRFQGLFADLDAAGYKVRSLGEGGYSFRKVAGSSNLSKHSFGEAVDINPRENPWSRNFRTDMPDNIGEIARKNGLKWGGEWNKPDTMHFQVDKSIERLGQSASAATKPLDTMATSAVQAAQSAGSMAQSTASAAQSISSLPNIIQSMMGGGSGVGGIFKGLFGGLSSIVGGGFGYMGTPFSPFAAAGNISPRWFHEGGVAGFDGQARGAVSASLFMNAQRYHGGGLAADEVPAILQRGERVLNRRDTAAYDRSANSNQREPANININIKGARGNAEIQMMVSAGIKQGLAEYDKALPGRVGEVMERYG